jgi:hypothetical protein
MRLTPELFEQITGVKESSMEQSHVKNGGDLREAPRLPLAFRSSACRIDGGQYRDPIQVQVCDISAISIGLTHAVEDRLGKTFVIALKPRNKGDAIAVHCEMSNFRAAGQTRLRVGATFVRLGDEQDVRRCLGLAPVLTPVPEKSVIAAPPASPSTCSDENAVVPIASSTLISTAEIGLSIPGPDEMAPIPDAAEVQRVRKAVLS